MTYTVHEAKTQLSRLLQEACDGKDVVIARGKKPIAKIVAMGSARKKRIPGRLKGQISFSPDVFAALSDRELKELGFE
jgi:antitoxin (DNA-binding transcriptional repressor) of toxin-antitoxin stability system